MTCMELKLELKLILLFISNLIRIRGFRWLLVVLSKFFIGELRSGFDEV